MAKIALAIGLGVLGLLTGGLAFAAEGAVFSAANAALGWSVGYAVGSVLGNALFPGHAYVTGPRLNDLQVSSSANGAPRPFGYGSFRIGGQIIWSSGIIETKTTTTQSAKGGPKVTNTTYSYSISFAAAFCEGEASITRIWADSKLIYDRTGTGATASDKLATGINNQTKVVVPAIYAGSTSQNPDPTIQAAEGVTATPAFRGTCYIVYADFPLADFGNRLPNIRAEITTGVAGVYTKDQYNTTFFSSDYAAFTYVDPTNRKAYIMAGPLGAGGGELDPTGREVIQVNLAADSTSPLNAWPVSTVEAVGNEILDSNGNVQVVASVTSDAMTGSSAPTWGSHEGDTTTDNHVTWRNLGVGPEAITITARGTFQPYLTGNEHIDEWFTFSKGQGMNVDPFGHIWNFIRVNAAAEPATTLKTYLQCYDSQTFQGIARYEIPIVEFHGEGDMSSITFGTIKGQTYLIATTGSNQSAKIYFIPISQNGAKTPGFGGTQTASWANNDSFGDFTACVSDNDHVYMATRGAGLGHNINWYIVDYHAVAWFTIPRFSPNMGDGTLNHVAYCVLYNKSDATLIALTLGGQVLKIDPTDWTVLASLPSNTIHFNSQNADPKYSTMYASGQIPDDGIFRGFDASGNLVEIDCNTLTVLETKALTNWFTNPSPNISFVRGAAYDWATNSIVMTMDTSTTYRGAAYRIYVDRQQVGGEDLGDVVRDILERAGIPSGSIDVTLLAGTTVLGYPITRVTDAKSILTALTQAYFFDLVESDFKVKAVPRGGATALAIPEADLGLTSEQNKVQETIAQEHDLPKTVTVMYSDPALDYQQGKTQRQRHARVKRTKNQMVLELPLTLTADSAAQIADKALHTWWAERNMYDFKLWKATYLKLDPTDVIQFTYQGLPFIARLVKTSVGANFVMEITGCSEDARNYLSGITGTSGDGFVGQSLDPTAPTLLFLLDIPLLQDADVGPDGNTGFYWGMASAANGWPGAALDYSLDGTDFLPISFSSDNVAYGYSLNQLGTPASKWTWDDINTLTVSVRKGATLSSTTDLAVLNGANGAYVGGEIIQFVNATLNADGTYTLSRLLRGRRGTDYLVDQHSSNETFIYLNAGVHRNTMATSVVRNQRFFKAVTIGQSVDSAVSQAETLEGMDLRPYAPAQLTVNVDGGGNWSMAWVRRTRVGGDWLDGTGTVPLSEDSELYDLEILDASGNILRAAYGLTDPNYFYTAANALADYGIAPTFVYVRVYQVSAQVGKGFPATNSTVGEAVLDFGGGADATSINGIPVVGTPVSGQVLEYNGTNWVPAAGGGGGGPRTTTNVTTGSLNNGQSETGTATLAKSIALLKATTTRDVRVQLYSTAAHRTADASRAVGVAPTPGTQHGIIADFVLTSATASWDFSPPLIGSNLDGTPAAQIYYRITNLGSTGAITVGLTYLSMET